MTHQGKLRALALACSVCFPGLLPLACQSETAVYRPARDPGPAPAANKPAAAASKPSTAAVRAEKPAPTLPAPAPPAKAAGATDKAAASTYLSRCAVCHGALGRSDGQMSRMLNPKPRSFADPTWQASVSDARIRQIILGGGAAVGGSPSMPASPDLKDKPALLEGLVKLLRSFKRDP